MNPEPGQHVKLFFRNGLVEEGRVVSWSDDKSVLKSLASDNLLIIQHTAHDVVAIKVFVYEKLAEQEESAPRSVYIDKELELPAPERDMTLRALKLAELRKIRAHEERELAREMMTTFKPTGGFSIDSSENYGYPNFLQSSDFDSAKED
jgi:hypothetical protein